MKIQFLTALIACLLAVGVTRAQDPREKESYKQLKSRSSQSTIEQLLSEAQSARATDPARALTLLQEAVGMSIAQRDERNEARCYLLIGDINERIGEWKLALANYETATTLLQANHTASDEFAQALESAGRMHARLGDHVPALQLFQQALSRATTREKQVQLTVEIAEAYLAQGNTDQAAATLQTLPSRKTRNESNIDARIQSINARIYARKNETARAQDYYRSSQNTLRSAGAVSPKASEAEVSAKEEISSTLREQKKYEEDISLRNRSIAYNLESNNLEEVSSDKIQLSQTLAAKGENTQAIKELTEAATIADTIGNPAKQANAFLTLAQLYTKNNRMREAVNAYAKYSEAIQRAEKQHAQKLAERADLIRIQKDIEEFTKQVSIGQREESLAQITLQRQRLIIYGLLVLIGVLLVTAYLIYKNVLASKRANQLLALKSLRSQMNPHFIFNALNSVNQFIAQNDERTANQFLSEFSKLMRLVLDHSQQDFISLAKEEELLVLYLKLEHYRFRDKFDYSFTVEESIQKENTVIPPMLIQPYIENAVWHGLRYKETRGQLRVHIGQQQRAVVVTVADDGIGRQRSAELKTENQRKHQSTGIKNIEQRLAILNELHKTNFVVTLTDPPTGGTEVTIRMPLRLTTHP
ncbi:MAG: histidine kinase [Cyclobacteriaceae bacterium]|jgi:tetratricopeptide (TPR) repeat protein|nr:histidine kinase [Cyclobacteriaceae bacterium]